MMCDRCKKREATFHKSVYINGKGYETNLCSVCADELDFDIDISDLGLGEIERTFADIEKEFMSDMFLEDFFAPTRLMEKSDKKCKTCGSSFTDFLKRGRLGCADCYETFEVEIRDMLENMDNPTDFTLDLGSELKVQEPSELEKLQQDFNKAIEEERYEEAGELKKKINEIKDKEKK